MFSIQVRSIMNKMRRALQNRDAVGDFLPFSWEWEERRDYYASLERLFGNTIYRSQSEGGEREVILRDILGRASIAHPLAGHYNPVQTICEAYGNIFRGSWGRDIWANDGEGNPLASDDPLYAALTNIWTFSKFNRQKQVLQQWCPLYGTVGIRISGRDDPDPRRRRVRLQVDHPGRIVDYDEDADGNVTAVLLEYTELWGGLGEERKVRVVREELSKTHFYREIDGKAEYRVENELQVCPYVILQHRDVGREYGVPAFYGSEPLIHAINWRISRQDTSIDRNQFPKWFATGAGEQPESFDLEDTKVIYVQTEAGDPLPTLQAIVPTLDQANITQFWQAMQDLLKERQPELVLNDLKSLSGQSGETIAQLLKPAEQRIAEAAGHYEEAVRTAMQIATSWMILLDMVDLGTGSGTQEAADRAYYEGKENFTFNERSYLPPSAYDRLKVAEADDKQRSLDLAAARAAQGLVSRREQLRIAGYSEDRIEEILDEMRTEDVILDPLDDEPALDDENPED